MLVWQGLGAYALVIPFFLWLGVLFAATSVLGKEATDQIGRVLGGVSLLVSAGLLYWLNQRLERRPGWEVVDKKTGEEVTIRAKHTMFFVPLRYWSIFYAVVAAILIVLGVVSR